MGVPPLAARLRLLDYSTADPGSADHRPAEAIAAEITRATPVPDKGDGSAPNPDEDLRLIVQAVTPAGTGTPNGG